MGASVPGHGYDPGAVGSSERRPAPRFWVDYLTAVLVGVIAFAACFVVLRGPTQEFFDWMIFGGSETPDRFGPGARDYIAFVYVVLGAVMIGWMVALLALTRGPLAAGERWGWLAVAGSLGTWFAIDTTFSLALGYPENAVLNAVVGAAAAIGLAATRPGRR
jgi:hypothetical protein